MDTSVSEAELSLNDASRYFDNPDQFSGLDEGIERAIHVYQQRAKYGKHWEDQKREDKNL